MIDTRFYSISKTYTINEIAQAIDCNYTFEKNLDPANIVINNVTTLSKATEGDIAVFNNKKYIQDFKDTRATACIVDETISSELNPNLILLRSKTPYLSYQKLIKLLYKPAKSRSEYISKSAHISPLAVIGTNCYIGHNVVIDDYATIGDNSVIEAGSFIDYGVVIGERATIYANVSISYSVIGSDVVILAGARIGQDGFGFATKGGVHHKIFHIGKVIIGNNVEIGANTTIDRGSLEDTIIEDLCRIDNLVQIGHNVHIGRGSVVVAQAGIAGSAIIGDYCALGGQSGIAGHAKIGEQCQIAAQSGVISDLTARSIVSGMPAIPIMTWRRQSVILKNLAKK